MEEHGYLALPKFYGDAELDDHARANHRFKVNDLYLESRATRSLALNERITPILSALLGSTPLLCNSLNLRQGSAQADHVDSLYMTPRSENKMLAIWVALEDVHADAGPLRYFPRSHKIPQYVFSTGSHHAVDAEIDRWAHYMQAKVSEHGLEPVTFLAKKGDVFIWSAYLLHGGSAISDPARTRRSLVFHYFSEEDCVANRCTLVPDGGAYWMHRPHQPVPGHGAPEAPPLPYNARVPA